MRKKTLEKRLQRLMARRTALGNKAQASESAEEVRAINEQLIELNEDIADVQEELDAIAEEERSAEEKRTAEQPVSSEQRADVPADAKLVNAGIAASFSVPAAVSQTRSTASTVSPRQKLDKVGKIQFTYHTAEKRIAQIFLS